MKINRSLLIALVLVTAVTGIFFQLFVDKGVWPPLIAIGLVLLTIFAFQADERSLITVLILILALGSYYRAYIAAGTFWVRFYFMGLIAIRGLFLFLESKRDPSGLSRGPATPLHLGFMLMCIVSLMSSFYSLDRSVSVQRSISLWLFYFVVFVYYWIRSSDARVRERYIISLLISCAIILGSGYVSILAGNGNAFMGGRLRLLFWNPNQLGHYCVLVLPLAVWLALDPARTTYKKSRWALLMAILVTMVWTGSRGAIIAAAAALVPQVVLVYRKKLPILIFAVFAIVSAHFLMESGVEYPGVPSTSFEHTFVREESLKTASGRTDIWKAAMIHVGREPYFGYGFGVVEELFKRGYFPMEGFFGSTTHNSYIDSLLGLGWIGSLPLFFCMLYLLISGSASILRPDLWNNAYPLACALYAVIVGASISVIVESWLISVGSVHAFPFWISAMLFIRMRVARRQSMS